MMDEISSKQVCSEVLKALEKAIRCSQNLPERKELQLIRVTSPSLKEDGNQLTERVLSEIKSVASRYAVSSASSDTDSNPSQSSGSLSIRDSMFDQAAETTDEALQHFNVALDGARKIKNAIVPPQGALGPKPSAPRVGIGYIGRSYGGALDIEKPQIHFPDYPVDNSDAPFVPPYVKDQASDPSMLQANAGKHSTTNVETYLQELYKKNSNPDCDQRHPYENEIMSAQQEMSSKDFKIDQVTIYKPIKSTPCTFITTEEELFNMVERLKNASSIAVDLENHSLRSYQGFTCLIQISTREEDIVIDALRLRGSLHRALAPVFTDETVVKVLHGADKDVQWLERDFGIYVVNMFDTGQAARLLKLPSASLSFLLAHFCDVSGINKKKFQLADWRQRPLPKSMFEYARSDTHYLLYVYDRLRCELAKKGLLQKAWERSAGISRKRHRKALFEPGVAKHLAARHSLRFDKHQIRLLEELCKWRDVTAREEDESYPYVAPLKVLFGIVRARDKARTVEGLMKHGFPGGFIPPLVYKNSKKLTELIRDALDAKLDTGAEDKNVGCCNNLGRPLNGLSIHTETEFILTKSHKQAGVCNRRVTENMKSSDVPNTLVSPPSDGETENHELAERAVEKKTTNSLPNCLKLNIRSTSRSALLDSDSDSDSVDLEHRSHIRHEAGNNLLEGGKESACVASEVVPSKKSYEGEIPDSSDARAIDKPCNVDETVHSAQEGRNWIVESQKCSAKTAEQSAFDLGGKAVDEQKENCGETVQKTLNDKVAQVKAEIAAEQQRIRASLDFPVELDEPGKKENDAVNKEDTEVEEHKSKAEEEIISLREAARRTEKTKSKKRKRKVKQPSSHEKATPLPPLPAFNYEKAIASEKQTSQTETGSDQFHPMRKLREDWKKDGTRRVRKRRRGKGQSMSFKSR